MRQTPKLEVVTAANEEPVVVQQLADWLGVSANDSLLEGFLVGARDVCERQLGIGLVTQVIRQWFDLPTIDDKWWDGVREAPVTEVSNLPNELCLARWPLQSLASVTFYADDDSASVAAAASYYVSKSARPPVVVLRPGYSWPSIIYRIKDTIAVQSSVGFGTADDVPTAIKNGILALAAFSYEHRGACDVDEALAKSGALEYWKPYIVRKT